MAWEDERVDSNVYTQGEVERWVYSTCAICSVGCGCYVAVKDGKVVGIKGNAKHPILGTSHIAHRRARDRSTWRDSRAPRRTAPRAASAPTPRSATRTTPGT